jgi:tRNA 2-thiocytidine biosynthesis protein TtcA
MKVPIAKPPWTKLGCRVESMIRKAIYEFKLIDPETKNLAIALSGGKDSLLLLYMLAAIRGCGVPDFKIHAIHVTGEFSCGAGVNISLLEGICKELDVNLAVCESTQKLETLECYRCSRERRRLIFDTAKSFGASSIAFGHHRDDNAETLLMNLLHKAELEGMIPKVPMHKFGVTIIRPLIYVSQDEISSFAKQQNFLRIMCRCPVGQNSMRRKVGDIIKELEEIYPNVRSNIAQAALKYSSGKATRI